MLGCSGNRLLTMAEMAEYDRVSERPTCFISCGMRSHTPGAGLATFGYHDGKLIHSVWFEASDSVAESCSVCRLYTQQRCRIDTLKYKMQYITEAIKIFLPINSSRHNEINNAS